MKDLYKLKPLKTLSVDELGTSTPEELIPFVKKYHDKLEIFTEEFVKDCIKENIDYCSAYGFVFSRAMALLTMKYSKALYEIEKQKRKQNYETNDYNKTDQ